MENICFTTVSVGIWENISLSLQCLVSTLVHLRLPCWQKQKEWMYFLYRSLLSFIVCSTPLETTCISFTLISHIETPTSLLWIKSYNHSSLIFLSMWQKWSIFPQHLSVLYFPVASKPCVLGTVLGDTALLFTSTAGVLHMMTILGGHTKITFLHSSTPSLLSSQALGLLWYLEWLL